MTPLPFQDVDIVVAPCQGLRPTVDVLGDLVNDSLPVITYALHKDELSERDEQELQEIRKYFSFPIFFFKVPKLDSEIIDSPTRRMENERSPLHRQLIDLGYLSAGHCNWGAAGQDAKAQSMLVEQSEKLRHLSTFSQQMLQARLIDAAKALNLVHSCCLDIFINQAFDMQRDLQITPKRLEYTRKMENELYESLMNIANRKQEEMKDMIVETLNTMKEELLDDAANMEFKGRSPRAWWGARTTGASALSSWKWRNSGLSLYTAVIISHSAREASCSQRPSWKKPLPFLPRTLSPPFSKSILRCSVTSSSCLGPCPSWSWRRVA